MAINDTQYDISVTTFTENDLCADLFNYEQCMYMEKVLKVFVDKFEREKKFVRKLKEKIREIDGKCSSSKHNIKQFANQNIQFETKEHYKDALPNIVQQIVHSIEANVKNRDRSVEGNMGNNSHHVRNSLKCIK